MFYYFIYLAKGFRMRPKVWSTLNATLQNNDTFVCDVIEAQWMHWSELYFDQVCLIYFTKDWNKFYFKSLFTLARILNVLRDRLELLPSVHALSPITNYCPSLNQRKGENRN